MFYREILKTGRPPVVYRLRHGQYRLDRPIQRGLFDIADAALAKALALPLPQLALDESSILLRTRGTAD